MPQMAPQMPQRLPNGIEIAPYQPGGASRAPAFGAPFGGQFPGLSRGWHHCLAPGQPAPFQPFVPGQFPGAGYGASASSGPKGGDRPSRGRLT